MPRVLSAILSACILSMLVSCASGSGGGSPSDDNPANTGGSSPKHVYISGWVRASSTQIPVYWKDGAMTAMAASGTTYSIDEDSTGNVYIGGASPTGIGYWKNGGNPTALSGSPTNVWGVGGDSAGNMYFFGTPSSTNCIPTYWKNGGAGTVLPYVSGNTAGYVQQSAPDKSGNIYAVGSQWNSSTGVTGYWKISSSGAATFTTLSLGSYSSGNWPDRSIAISSDGVVAAIVANSTAAIYWPNPASAPTSLSLPKGYAYFGGCPSAAFDGSGNLIFAGTVGTTIDSSSNVTDPVPVYWTNGTPTLLARGTGNTNGGTSGIVVGP